MHSYDPKLFRWSSSSPGFPWLPCLKMSVPLMSDWKNLTNVQHLLYQLYQTYQMKDEDIWVSHLINFPTLWKAVFFVVLHVLPENPRRTHQQKHPHLAETDWTSRSYALIITVLGFPTASEYEIIGEAKKRSTGRGKARRNFTPPTKRCFQARQLVVEGKYLGSYILGRWELPRLTTGLGGGEPDAEKKALVISSRCRCRM